MKGKLFVFCGVTLIVLALLFAAHRVMGAEVEVASLDSGQQPTWLRGYGERTVGAAETGSSGRTLQIPEPAAGFSQRMGAETIEKSVLWNFLNTKNQRWCFDAGRSLDDNYWLIDATWNLGSLADHGWDIPLAQYINPRIGLQGGYDVDGYLDSDGKTKHLDGGLQLVLVQFSW